MDMLELLDASKPNHAPITNGSDFRSLSNYMEVVRQFKVETNPRYQIREVSRPGIKETFCNIFVWDVTRAMCAEIPHWYVNYTKLPDGTVKALGSEFNANKVCEWLTGDWASRYGWTPLPDSLMAIDYANLGRPTVATYYNPTGIGHVAMVVPPGFLASSDFRPGVVAVAQAGSSNFTCKPISSGFGNLPVKFYGHK